MALNFPNVTVLGIASESRFFDAGFQYASFKRLNIAGTINDLGNSFGISGIWDGGQGLLATVRNNRDYQALVLNGVDFGSGRIEDISFEPGNDVFLKGYQASLLVYDSGNLFNFAGTYYSGIDTSNFPNIQNFSESYAFNKKLNGGYSYTHDATIQLISGANQLNAISGAQALARTLFTGSNLGFAFYSGYTNRQGKRYFTEFYNSIDSSCSFSERFDFDNDNGKFSAIQNVSLQLDDKGVLTATEQGIIRGIENPNYQNALSAVASQLTGSYLRCSGAATFYFPTGALLITSPITQGRVIDIFNNNVGYTVVFNNNPNNSGTYFWDYTQQVTRQDDIGTIVENGAIIGRGVNETDSFINAQGGFSVIRPGIAGRVTSLFTSNFGSPTNFLENKQETYSPVQGQISYGYQYSNDPTLIANAGIRRKAVTEDENAPVYQYNKANIFNFAEVIQDGKQSTVGSTNVTIAMEGDKTVTLATFLAAAVAEINSRIPFGSELYVGDGSYSYDPNQNNVNVSLTWRYNRGAVKTLFPTNT